MEIFEFINRSAYFFGAILISLTCIFYTILQRRFDRPQTRLYIMMLFITVSTSIAEMVGMYVEPFCLTSDAAWYTHRIANYIYFNLHVQLIMIFYFYALFATQNFRRYKYSFLSMTMIPCVIVDLLALTNPLTHFVWYYDELHAFHRNWGEYFMYAVFGVYYVVTMTMLIFRWYSATRKRKMIIIIVSAFSLVGVLIQLFVPKLDMELFAEAVAFMGLMLAVEYDDDKKDVLTSLWNRSTFMQDIKFYHDMQSRFYIICVRLNNLDAYQRMPDAMEIRDVHVAVVNKLAKIYPRYLMYRVNSENYVLLIHNKNKKYVNELVEKISGIMIEGTAFEPNDPRVSGIVLQATVPDELHTASDIFLMCDGNMPDIPNGTILKTQDLQDIFKKAEIEQALFRGFSKNCFEVFYQLVYTADKGEVRSAEALLRLHDEKLGLLLPQEFIPMAERNGIIDRIGAFVIQRVCEFIQSGDADKLGIEYVNINLSMLQCMRPNYAERIKQLVKAYKVDPKRITFEIRESLAADDYSRFISFIDDCHAEGFRLSMEGYGTGYSNLYAVMSLNFDEIKLDKRMIWEADQNDYGRVILEKSIQMLHDLERPITAVGVESEEQLERLKAMGVDYVQGFYMSMPQRVDELMEMVV